MFDACTRCPVRASAVCHSLSPDELDDLSRAGQRKVVEPGETLMWEGDDALLVGNVIEGVLKLSLTTPDGRDQTLGLAYPGDFIGRPFGRTTRQGVTALTGARVCLFRRSSFDAFARRHPQVEHDLLERTLGELDRARDWMVLLARMSAPQRLAAFLLELASRIGTPVDAGGENGDGGEAEYGAGPVRIDLPFGRQAIADILGLTIETVSRQITRLRDAGTIATPGRRTIMLLHPERLRAALN